MTTKTKDLPIVREVADELLGLRFDDERWSWGPRGPLTDAERSRLSRSVELAQIVFRHRPISNAVIRRLLEQDFTHGLPRFRLRLSSTLGVLRP